MRNELKSCYELELKYIRQMGAEFADKYPKIASRLRLEPNRCEDPHVERLLEAFAFLAARVHLKIDDEFPQITHALLDVLYPHFIRPIPSMTVVQFHQDPEQGQQTAGAEIERGSMLYSRPVDGVPLKFQTCYDTTLWPLSVEALEWTTPDRLKPPVKSSKAVAALRLQLRCFPDVSLDSLEMDSLRFYLDADSNLANILYELLCNNCFEILLRNGAPPKKLKTVSRPSQILQPVGFKEEEAILPYPKRSFVGYRLLQEYFTFPKKFFFFDLIGLDDVWKQGFTEQAEILFLLSRFELPDRQRSIELGLSEKTVRLGCTPVVNLFSQPADPISLSHRRFQYPVVPDARRRTSTEIFSIDKVTGATDSGEAIRYEPFYSYRHGVERSSGEAFWYATRRPSQLKNDQGSEVDLTLVDLSGRPVKPDAESLSLRVTCTNRDLPSQVKFSGDESHFELEGGTGIERIVALMEPTKPLRPPMRKDAFWPMISQLSLNYLSLVSEGKEALQEILRLYNFNHSEHLEKQILGIRELHSARHFARMISENGITLARGTQVDIEFDEDEFSGGGVYLFAGVIEHFLGMYVSLNSFSQLIAHTRQRKEPLKKWPPRAGETILM